MNAETIIRAISSSGEPYNVKFIFNNNKLTVSCDCPAGIYGKLCKHKIGLLANDISLLFDKSDQESLQKISNIVKNSNYEKMMSEYNITKREIEMAQKKEKKIKEQLEQALKTGIDIK